MSLFRIIGGANALLRTACLGIALLVLPQAGPATTIDFQATALNTNADAALGALIPYGTMASTAFTLDIGPGLVTDPPSVTLLDGSFSWENGGTQMLNLSGVSITAYGFGGQLELEFGAPTLLLGGYEVVGAVVDFDLGVNPYTTPDDFADVLTTSAAITGLGLVFKPSPTYIRWERFDGEVTSSIAARVVPLPAAGWLLIGGLGALAGLRRWRLRG